MRLFFMVMCAATLAACGNATSGGDSRDHGHEAPLSAMAGCGPVGGDEDTPSTPGDDDAPGDDDPTEAPQPAIVPVVSGGYAVLDSTYQRLHGPGLFTIDTLWEVNLGRGVSSMASQRFRAPASGNIASLKQYFWGSPGYSAGVGGTVRLRVYPDDGSATHAPDMSGPPLATGVFYPSMSGGSFTSSSQAFSAVAMSSSAALVEGQLYHVVYSNDLNSGSDFISLDLAASNLSKHGRANRWLDATDWGVLRRSNDTGGAWHDSSRDDHYGGRACFTPVLQVTMADGLVFGSYPMEVGSRAEHVFQASPGAPVRERFTLSSTRTITAISVHTAAEVAGVLRWEIKRGADVVASGDITQPTANYGTDETIQAGRQQGNVVWYDAALANPIVIDAGETYDLVLTPQGASRWRFINQRNGRAYGVSWGANQVYESYAQHFRNGQWLNSYFWNFDTSGTQGDSNWPVVLHME